MVAAYFSPKVNRYFGIDFAESLLNSAIQRVQEAEFFEANAQDFEHLLPAKADKSLLHFSFQYFEQDQEAKKVLAELIKATKKGGLILISDIPDSRKWLKYYKSFKDKLRFVYQRFLGKEDMGRFWSKRLLLEWCEDFGVKGEIIKQDLSLPYAHYRFDLLIRT